jgi:hypothetical protein
MATTQIHIMHATNDTLLENGVNEYLRLKAKTITVQRIQYIEQTVGALIKPGVCITYTLN